ncbi:MAG: hypothetical protein PF637_06580 [Spirochaetes bacterium]|jgi:hypothetical protein|nr:hypothetical protein [Spirochaetota bacterium]
MIKKIIFAVFFLAPLVIFAGFSVAEKGYLLFQLGDKSALPGPGWINHADSTQLLHWGQSRELNLVEDAAPVTNQKASFIAASSASLHITDLKPHATYTLWVDFVKFRFKKNSGVYSKLHIYADGRQIDELVWGKLSPDTLYQIDLPLDLTYDGDVVITFKEYAMNYGYWGVWDIIIATGDLPDGSYFRGVVPSAAEKSDLTKDSTKSSVSGAKSAEAKSDIKAGDGSSGRTILEKKPRSGKKVAPKPKRPTKRSTPVKKAPVAPKSPVDKSPTVSSPVGPMMPYVDEPLVDKPKIPEQPKTR